MVNDPEYQRRYYQKNKERLNQKHYEYNRRIKLQFFKWLGNKCACKGCSWHKGKCVVNSFEVMQVDHIDGKGNRERSQSNSNSFTLMALRRMRDNNKSNLQLLCANCHLHKTYSHGDHYNDE